MNKQLACTVEKLVIWQIYLRLKAAQNAKIKKLVCLLNIWKHKLHIDRDENSTLS